MANVLDIVQTGDPVLRRRARELTVAELATPRIRTLIEQLRDTMRAAPGVGLAAPQIGESIRLLVIENPPSLQPELTPAQIAERERDAVPFHVLVNPVLTLVGDDRVEAFEGCLSFSGFVMVVARARTVRVEALDEHGTPVAITATGWYARILQHEVDHLEGTLCCDRMDARTLSTADNYTRHLRAKSIAEVRATLDGADAPGRTS